MDNASEDVEMRDTAVENRRDLERRDGDLQGGADSETTSHETGKGKEFVVKEENCTTSRVSLVCSD